MPRRLLLMVLLLALGLWLAASYGVRFGLMEDGRWVGLCADDATRWECGLRSQLGWAIHFGVFGKLALGLSLLAFCVPRQAGWWLAVLAMLVTLPALALYNAGFAVFAVVLAALRLVRTPKAG
ncbi:hypothetical protein HNP46_002842 [Pseudomonas nitritireducens]|uniref:Uncharacterized protein n=1 Tax=Pseudomonas nitroreducens TaxID=46680 RepID=A0A7W7KJI6_PSENT|nr:hypothetical protein [Pseudomonas nitritireducens]MBB4863982.1 hypothetical protein [Pseudomonas nitritireducens]